MPTRSALQELATLAAISCGFSHGCVMGPSGEIAVADLGLPSAQSSGSGSGPRPDSRPDSGSVLGPCSSSDSRPLPWSEWQALIQTLHVACAPDSLHVYDNLSADRRFAFMRVGAVAGPDSLASRAGASPGAADVPGSLVVVVLGRRKDEKTGVARARWLLCVADPRAGTPGPRERRGLQLVARQLGRVVDARRSDDRRTEVPRPDDPRRDRQRTEASEEVTRPMHAGVDANQFAFALKVAQLGTWAWDAASDTIQMSRESAKLMGMDETVVSRRAVRERFAPEARESSRLVFEDALANRRGYDIEVPIDGNDGQRRWIGIHARGVYAPDGRCLSMLGFAQDVSERKRVEAELRANSRRVGLLSEISAIGGVSKDPRDLMTEALARIAREMGVDDGGFANVVDEVIMPGEGFALRISGEEAGSLVVHRGTVDRLKSGELVAVNDVLADLPERSHGLLKNGVRAFLAVPIHRQGQLVAVIEVHDQKPRKWDDEDLLLMRAAADRLWMFFDSAIAHRESRRAERQFREAADSIPQLAWMARPGGQIFWLNRRWHEYTGAQFDESVGDGWAEWIDPAERDRVLNGWRDAVKNGDSQWEDMFPLRRHDGREHWHLARALPLREEGSAKSLWFGTFTDISEQRAIAQERERLLVAERMAREQAEYASKMKDDFLAVLSHELRTPLTAILGWVQVLQRDRGDARILRDGIDAIERNACTQTQIIEDLLDMSRIAAGKVRLDRKPLSLVPVIDATLRTLQPQILARDIAVDLQCAPGIAQVFADRERMQQIMWNLLSNAVRFTPRKGRISVDLRQVGAMVQLEVADNGEGIDPEQLPRLFERFAQGDASRTRRHGGLGLGLSIVRNLVELHGGTIAAFSEGHGKGARFTVQLPVMRQRAVSAHEGRQRAHASLEEASGAGAQIELRPRPTPAPGAATPPREHAGDPRTSKRIRVLIVDDQADNRVVIRHLLERGGIEVLEADSVSRAMAMLHGAAPAVIVTDIGMPGEDGYGLLRRVQLMQRESVNRMPPVIALSAYTQEEDRTRALASGFSAYLPKPIDPDRLLASIDDAVRRH